MNLTRLEAFLKGHRTLSVLCGLLLLFAGVDLLFTPQKGQYIELVGIPLVAAGLGLLALTFRGAGKEAIAEPRPTLASRFLDRVTFRRRLVRFFPAFAIVAIVLDLAYNILVFDNLSLGTEDTSVLLLAAALFAYPFVPARFGRERDFSLLFLIVLILVLVLPLLLARLYYRDWERSVDIYSWTALAPQTAGVLSLLGIPSQVHALAGSTAPAITFTTRAGAQITVVISTACSGIYSFGIFASAFVAFVLTEYERFQPKVLALLALGFVTSYVANILRMVLIVLFGVYSGSEQESVQAMLVAHSNLGWIIFLGWITLFWALVFKFFIQAPAAPAAPRKRGVLCGICADALTPALPGYRCECGRFYHVACAATVEECLRCHRPMKLGREDERGSAAR